MIRRSINQRFVNFGAGLVEPDSAALRDYLERLLSSGTGPSVLVDTLFSIDAAATDTPRGTLPLHYLVLDPIRIYLFHDGARANDACIRSLIAFIKDGYWCRSYTELAEYERAHSYRFSFQLSALDIAATCMAELQPSHYCSIDLVFGNITFARLFPHPEIGQRSVHSAADARRDRQGLSKLRIQPIQADSTLRTGTRPLLDDLVQDVAGLIRTEHGYADAASLASAVATTSFNEGRHIESCHGKSLTPQQALLVARCEAAERFQVAYPPPRAELVRGRYSDLSDIAVDPRSLFIDVTSDADRKEALPVADIELSWTWAWAVAENEWQLTPAQDIWFRVPEQTNESRLVSCTTSGCALGTTLEEAAIFAALELVERDAFLTSWYLRRRATIIDPLSSYLEATRLLVNRFRWSFPDYRLVLLDITPDTGVPTVCGFAFRIKGDGPCVYASAASHIDPEQACFKALKDLMGFSPQRPIATKTSTAESSRPAAHFQYFASDVASTEFEYLHLESAECIRVEEIGACSRANVRYHVRVQVRLDEILLALADALRRVGAQLLIKDMTHPTIRDRSLWMVRAIAPGLYPLWFGRHATRFAVTDRLRTLSYLYTGNDLDIPALRLTTHPLS